MNEKQIKALLKAGKIRGYTVVVAGGRGEGKTHATKVLRGSAAKTGLEESLKKLCHENRIPLFYEQRFHVERRWRFDWLLITPKGPVAIEYEGLAYHRTGHTSSDGYSDNTTKYREAAKQGIVVLRYTYQNFEQCVTDLKMSFL